MAVKQTKKTAAKAAPVQVEVKDPRNYEMVTVFRSGATDADNEQAAEQITQLITSLGGTITKQEPWGKKKLAYPIAHLTEGYYILTNFSMSPTNTNEMEKKLGINERVLRHMLILDES